MNPFNDEYFMKQALIVYGASDDKRGFSKFAPQAFHPKAIIKKGILEKECAEEMQRFFKQRR